MYPVVKASGTYSPGSAGTSSTVSNTTARASSYTIALPTTVKDRDVLMVFTSCDSGLPSDNVPVPSLAGHTFSFETFSGGDSTSGLHGGIFFVEFNADYAALTAKSVTYSLPKGTSNTADSAVIWVLFDGGSVYRTSSGVFDPGWIRNTTQITATTAHTISSQSAGGIEAPSGNYLALAFLVNDANSSSVSYSYTTPSGWTKVGEVGSREFLDSAVFSRTFDGSAGFASVTATYGASAAYTRVNIYIPGAPDFNVEQVGYTQAEIASGGSIWCDKPAGAAADDEPSTFNFRAQSTTKNRIVMQRFKNVHATRPIAHPWTQAGNTTTAATSHVSAALTAMSRAMMVQLFTVSSALAKWTAYSPSGATGIPQQPAGGGVQDTWVIYDNTSTAAAAKTATYATSATWNAQSFMIRAADTLASGAELLVAWHTMDASQNSSLMTTPDWGGWTLLGTTTRVSSAGAYNVKCYYKIVKAALSDLLWQAATDVGSTATDGLTAGYTGTQREISSGNSVSNPAALPFEAAPFGRPGFAIRADIPAPSYQRVEHNPNHRQFIAGDDYFFSFAFALPATFPTWVQDFWVIEQIHGAPGSGSPVVSFETREYKLRMRGGDGKPGASPSNQFAYELDLVKNLRVKRWYHVVYRILFSEATNGSAVDVWVDGTQVLSGFSPPGGTVYKTSVPSEGGPSYRKQGAYKRPAIEGGGDGCQPWHAGSALGRSFAAVDPARSQNPLPSPEMFAAA